MLLEVELDATVCADNAPKKCAEKCRKLEINLEKYKTLLWTLATGNIKAEGFYFQY